MELVEPEESVEPVEVRILMVLRLCTGSDVSGETSIKDNRSSHGPLQILRMDKMAASSSNSTPFKAPRRARSAHLPA